MGTAASAKKRPPSPEAMKRNTQIEKELALSRVMETKTIKLLLLGGAESGKSTIAKQMKILHLNGFSEYDLLHYRHLIYSNIITAFRQLILAIECLKIDATENQKMMISNFVQISDRLKNCEMSQELIFLAKALLPTSCFLEALQRRSEFELLDSAKYFFDDLDRITERNYMPTSQDILRSRAITLGIHEVEFNYKNYIFRMVDVGGQKTERRKWIHCFENVTAILFIASLSEYDQVSSEDGVTNRMQDSLQLFEAITCNQFLIKAATLLFLNKTDIFADKIAYSPLKLCFPDYTGLNNYEEASTYILDQFRSCLSGNRGFYHHLTNATDTKNVEVVFAASMNTVLNKTLSGIGMY